MIKEQFRKLRFLIAVIVFVVAAGAEMTANAQTQVTGTITGDNYWALYYEVNGVLTYSNLSGAYPTAPPVSFTVPAGSTYIYVLAWSDKATAQGFVAMLQSPYSSQLQTGVAPWMVAPNALPPNALPATLNSIQLTSLASSLNPGSLNWTTPSIGPPNSIAPNITLKPWSVLPGLSASHWIWYKKPSGNLPCFSATGSPLVPGCDHDEPLLFRLPVAAFKPCLAVTSDRTPCCIGRDSKGNPIYAFSATVNNPSSGAAPLTISGSAGITLLSYGPSSIPSGNSIVSGTFTVTSTAQAPICLVFEITLPDIVDSGGSDTGNTGRQSNSFTDQAAQPRKPLTKVKCRGPLCFRRLPDC